MSVIGSGAATTMTQVQVLPASQLQAASLTAAAVRPKEHTDGPPETLARRVSKEKVEEAAQLGETLTRTEGFARAEVAPASVNEVLATERSVVQTQTLIDYTSERIRQVFSETELGLQRLIEADPCCNPAFDLVDPDLRVEAGQVLLSFRGSGTIPFVPVVSVQGGTIVQDGESDALVVDAGVRVTIPGRLLELRDSTLATGGSVLHLAPGASLVSGEGFTGLLNLSGSSSVVAGAALVALDEASELTLGRPLMLSAGAHVVAGGRVQASVIDIGRGALVRTPLVPLVLVRGGRIEATGSLLSLSPDAQVTADPRLAASVDLLALVTVVGSPPEPNGTVPRLQVTLGRGLIELGPRASLSLGTEGLLKVDDTDFVTGVDDPRSAFISIGPGASIATANVLGSIFFEHGVSVTTSGAFLRLDEGASFVNEVQTAAPLIGLIDTSVRAGGNVLEIAAGARLGFGAAGLLEANASRISGASLLTLGPGASLDAPGAVSVPVLNIVNGSLLETSGDAIALSPLASLTTTRTLLNVNDAGALAGRNLLTLAGGAQLVSEAVSAFPLIFMSNSLLVADGDLVRLDSAAQLAINRPLFGATLGGNVVRLGGNILTLGASSTFSAGHGTEGFGIIQLEAGTVLSAGDSGGRAVAVGPGARMALEGRALFVSVENGQTTLPGGLLLVEPGGNVTASAIEGFSGLSGGQHDIATLPGTSMFDLRGVTTATDAPTGLMLGTDRPVVQPGVLFATAGATLRAQKLLKLDTALLEASAPLFAFTAGSAVTVGADALDLSHRSKVTSLGSLVRLDASTLTLTQGALVTLTGGSYLRVTGDLVELTGGSTLRLLNGPLLSASGGSVVNVSGALVAFGGSGNSVNIANSLCPCSLVSGVPVAFRDGALPGNVSIGPNPIRNPQAGSVTLTPTTAALVVSGPTTRVTVGGR